MYNKNKLFRIKIGVQIIVPIIGMLLLLSCNKDPKHPGYEYMPNMYRSPSYETNSSNSNFKDGLTNQKPVIGTIAIGASMPYPYANTLEGYEKAGLELKNPILINDTILEQGKNLFIAFCSPCHGKNGGGDGILIKNQKFPPPPSFQIQLKDLPEGKMFHSITYGKNLMGSHASQITAEERWKIIHFIKKLQQL
jgi:mono/diheme cytochrome c family protein